MSVTRKIFVLLLSLMVISLLFSACSTGEKTDPTASQKTTTSKTSTSASTMTKSDMPQYGGTFTGMMATDIRTFDIVSDFGGNGVNDLTNERLEDGDWTKGPAGGYGTNEVKWNGFLNLPQYRTGYLSNGISWTIDESAKTVTAVTTIKEGIHFALNPNSEASRLVNGREITADDVAWNLTERMNNPGTMMYSFTPLTHGVEAFKTGPQEVSVTIPLEDALSTLMKLFNNSPMVPPEVYKKYKDQSDWRNNVGTGPFMLNDYVAANSITLSRNKDYWMKDPIGPGKGNQLPYLDTVKWNIVPDLSTRLASMRTAKVDLISNLTPEDTDEILGQVPSLKKSDLEPQAVDELFMRTDKKPYSDIRVRQAMTIAINFNEMNESLYGGQAQIISFPYWYVKGYDDIYISVDSPDLPAMVKELFSYQPEKAKQLLAEAGYPDGFNTTLILDGIATQVDYYSIIKEYWKAIGINVTFDPRETNALFAVRSAKGYEELITCFESPPGTYPEQAQFTGTGWTNLSLINDPRCNEDAQKARDLYLRGDIKGAMKVTRDLTPYILEQCWVIGSLRYPTYVLWWPWLNNFSGEVNIGYINVDSYPRWVWIDQSLKKQMGH